MAKLRHIAMQVPDLERAARFYEQCFDLKRVHQAESPIGNAIMLSDGVMNLTLLNFPDGKGGMKHGPDWAGLHHFGFVVEDLEEYGERLVEHGAELMRPRPTTPTQFFEVKHRGPDGVVIDTSEHPWLGAAGLE